MPNWGRAAPLVLRIGDEALENSYTRAFFLFGVPKKRYHNRSVD